MTCPSSNWILAFRRMPGLQSALYFSAVTYTTTGYGDLVLPPEWRLLGGIEALTGILMHVTLPHFGIASGIRIATAWPSVTATTASVAPLVRSRVRAGRI